MPTPPDPEESFPELEAFLADQARRHRRLVVGLFVVGAVLVVAGALVVLLATGKLVYSGFLLMAMGVLMIVRGAISGFTDYDTKVRDDWVGVAPPDFAERFDDDQDP